MRFGLIQLRKIFVCRFHVLEEFDEGKRSCRRRLAGHNKRRRKANPDTIGNGTSMSDDQTSNYMLITLLKILSNIHCKLFMKVSVKISKF